ncbi:MAG: phage holin family protein [Sphingorhabdus sp.]
MNEQQPLGDDMTDPLPASEQLVRLVEDFRVMAEAEISYYRARLSYSAGVAKWTSLFVALALFSLFGAVVALILGLLLALAEVIGFLGATFCLTVGFVLVAALFAWVARNKVRKLSFPELEGTNDE